MIVWFPCSICQSEIRNWDICLQNSNYCNYFHGEIKEYTDLCDVVLNISLTPFLMFSLWAPILPKYILIFLILSKLSFKITKEPSMQLPCLQIFTASALSIPTTPLTLQSNISLLPNSGDTSQSISYLISRQNSMWLIPLFFEKIHPHGDDTMSWFFFCPLLLTFIY